MNRNQVFSLKLNSYSSKKRIFEALEVLKKIYPFKLTPEDVYIEKTKEKGVYSVYIGKIKNQKKRKFIKVSILFFLILITLIFSGIIINSVVESKNKEKIAKQEIENQNLQKIEKEKILNEELRLKKEKYEKLVNEEYHVVYSILEGLYKCLVGKSTIENISISKNNFFVEVTTNDCIKVLKKFEESNNFTLVKMNRITVINNSELVSYTGKYQETIEYPLDELRIEEKIKFYDEKINNFELEKQKEKELLISTYIEQIKKMLNKNSCNEEYIQIKGNFKDIEVECFFIAKSTDFLNFIKQIQELDVPKFKIKEIRINNKQNNIQVIVLFASGIEIKQDELKFLENKNIVIEPKDLSKLFNKTTINKNEYKIEKSQESQPIKKRIENKKLHYIGKITINNEIRIVVKDEEMNSLYKLLQLSEEINNNCFFMENGKMVAMINNKYYEVIK